MSHKEAAEWHFCVADNIQISFSQSCIAVTWSAVAPFIICTSLYHDLLRNNSRGFDASTRRAWLHMTLRRCLIAMILSLFGFDANTDTGVFSVVFLSN